MDIPWISALARTSRQRSADNRQAWRERLKYEKIYNSCGFLDSDSSGRLGIRAVEKPFEGDKEHYSVDE
jgi:hypothetical protein